ncbi:SH2 domain-containing protein 1A isoform X2 [Anas acuta]|uniref:SH2 domain-containing protein 1A isoform X2 n=1 Tax=Anas acuta TaxID=28680 RepID=UPI0035C8FE60
MAATCCGTVRASRGSTASACFFFSQGSTDPGLSASPHRGDAPGPISSLWPSAGLSRRSLSFLYWEAQNWTQYLRHQGYVYTYRVSKTETGSWSAEGEMTAVTSTCSQHEAISQSDMTVLPLVRALEQNKLYDSKYNSREDKRINY